MCSYLKVPAPFYEFSWAPAPKSQNTIAGVAHQRGHWSNAERASTLRQPAASGGVEECFGPEFGGALASAVAIAVAKSDDAAGYGAASDKKVGLEN